MSPLYYKSLIYILIVLPAGVSINFRSLSLLSEKEQKSPEKKDTIITPTKTLSIGSLGSHETPAEISVTPSSHVTNSVSQCYNNTCGSTNSERLGSATSFASVDREFSAIGDLKFDGSSMSFATVDGELSPVEDPEYDESLTTQEEVIFINVYLLFDKKKCLFTVNVTACQILINNRITLRLQNSVLSLVMTEGR